MSTSNERSRRGVRRAAAGIALLALVAGACSGGGDEPEREASGTTRGTEAPATTTTTEPVPDPVMPLTGEPLPADGPLGRPALVVKLNNVDGTSRPQAGLNEADLVFEEKVEGPISRFAAVYHSTEAPDLGPVRSGRSTDIAIVSSLNQPLYAFSGANAVTIQQLRSAPLVDIGYDVEPGAYERRRGRRAPDDVFTSTERLWALTPPGAGPPPQQLVYRAEGDELPAGARPVQGVDYSWGGGGAPVTYRWDDQVAGWARTQGGTAHVDAEGVHVAPPNLIVQKVTYLDTGLVDTSGAPVPEAQLVGEGDAWVLTDGHVVEGRWVRPDADVPTAYETRDGEPIGLTPGRTWIALVPADGDAALVEVGPPAPPTP